MIGSELHIGFPHSLSCICKVPQSYTFKDVRKFQDSIRLI